MTLLSILVPLLAIGIGSAAGAALAWGIARHRYRRRYTEADLLSLKAKLIAAGTSPGEFVELTPGEMAALAGLALTVPVTGFKSRLVVSPESDGMTRH